MKTKLILCPNCRAKLRIPVNKEITGKRSIKCPKCTKSFERNFGQSFLKDWKFKQTFFKDWKSGKSFREILISYGKPLINKIAKLLGYKSANEFLKHVDEIETAINQFKEYTNYDDYFGGSSYTNWLNKYENNHDKILTWFGKVRKIKGFEKLAQDFDAYITNGNQIREDYNENYLVRMLDEHKQYFDDYNQHGLTLQQRKAVIVDEDNNYINAGAGCGKTETVIAKIAYLVQKKKIKPEKILVLAYNKHAADEMRHRLSKLGVENIDVNTFHSFGYRIVGNVIEKKPDILFESNIEKRRFIQKQFDEILKTDTGLFRKLIYYFSFYLNEHKPIDDFEDLNDYLKFNKSGLRTLDGKYVKSKQEVYIANYLYLNCINYEYEKKYSHDTVTKERKQYKPDFYLTDYGIWLEHFAMKKDSSGNLISKFPGYMDGYAWKVKLHKEYNTRLLSTFSYQFDNGTINKALDKVVEDESIQVRKRKHNEIVADLKNYHKVTETNFTKLILKFISHCKSCQYSLENLFKEQTKLNNARNLAFLEILTPIFNAYQQELDDNQSIDFDDMIADARRYLKENRYCTDYDYIIIDEFQDISVGRLNLINEIKKQNSSAKTFCVGDDWQAIYGFAGADVSILYDFEKHFGEHSKRLFLTQTFRFSKELADLSNQFILKNPNQSVKKISSESSIEDAFDFVKKNNDESNEIIKIIEHISKTDKESKPTPLIKLKAKKKDILILNRYGYKDIKSRYDKIVKKSKQFKNVSVSYDTIHKQKGAQADFVIVDNINKGFTGFPNQMEEDSILYMVMKNPDKFIHADERRVFYVAITRSKIKTFMLAIEGDESSFFNEVFDSVNETKICPKCKGRMVKRINKTTEEEFLGCENFPICQHTGRLSSE